MAVFTAHLLSGSTNGRPIKVVATTTPGTLIHTAHATSLDEPWIYACNTSTAAVLLTLEWGGTTGPDDLLKFNIPPQSGLFCQNPGTRLTGGVIIRAFAASANVITIVGNVNRIT